MGPISPPEKYIGALYWAPFGSTPHNHDHNSFPGIPG